MSEWSETLSKAIGAPRCEQLFCAALVRRRWRQVRDARHVGCTYKANDSAVVRSSSSGAQASGLSSWRGTGRRRLVAPPLVKQSALLEQEAEPRRQAHAGNAHEKVELRGAHVAHVAHFVRVRSERKRLARAHQEHVVELVLRPIGRTADRAITARSEVVNSGRKAKEIGGNLRMK